MDIMAIVNTMQPNTISKQAYNAEDFPNGEESIQFMGVYVQLYPNAMLPDSGAVIAYENTYNIAISTQITNAAIKRQIYLLEQTITERRRDEAILGQDNGWLSNIRSQIISLRVQLK